MSGLDSNPFADPHAPSPFADPAVTQVTSRSQQAQSGLGLEDYNPFAEQPRPPTASPPQPSRNRLRLTRRAAAAVSRPRSPRPSSRSARRSSRKRRPELQAREEALRGAQFNARANNWPPLPDKCCVAPCFYQDIGVDIPLEFQKIVRTVYYLWIFYVLVLVLNFLGGLAILVKEGGATHFGFSILYLVLFAPLSFLCWFRPLYKAFRSDSSFNFMVFFFVFFVQLIVSVIYAVGIGTTGASGFVVAIDAFSKSIALGIFLTIVATGHAVNAAWSGIMLLRVHRLYRSTGASFAKAQQEFTAGVLRNEHVQGAAANVAAEAARTAVQQNLGSRY
ncbi:hypothetical protein HPB49_015551 [Dermacentor silvarum]|uniref:Uncharacterized protein n=1 Tax=Dermacentor silvarum TaxID=543639 RepID=A0ACB8DJF8_DERSI|nr:hypothetical protein HPB49_015551 [Dermacentor silvarum]